jgi:hypothetical protein
VLVPLLTASGHCGDSRPCQHLPLLYCFTALLLYCVTALLLYSSDLVLLLYCFTALLLYCFTALLLYSSDLALLLYCFTVLLLYCFTDCERAWRGRGGRRTAAASHAARLRGDARTATERPSRRARARAGMRALLLYGFFTAALLEMRSNAPSCAVALTTRACASRYSAYESVNRALLCCFTAVLVGARAGMVYKRALRECIGER